MREFTTSRRSILLGSLAAATAGSTLTACGGGDSASGGGGGDAKKITFWLSASDAQAKGYYDLADEFKTKQGITVEIVNVPYDGYQTKLRQAAQADSLPDVASAPSLDPICTNKLQDLTSVATSSTNKIDTKLYQKADSGKILTIPSDITAAGLFINASLFLAVSSAVMTCLVVVLLFVATLTKLHLGTLVALSFILAMLLLISSLVSFMVEVRLSLRAVHVRKELLG